MSIPLPPPIRVPQGFNIPAPSLETPELKLLKWEPVPIYREDIPALTPADESRSSQDDTAQEKSQPQSAPPTPELPTFDQVRSFTIPVIDKEVPVPPTEILVTAVSTATVASAASVAVTMGARSLFEQVLKLAKPVTKGILKKLAKVRHQEPPLTWGRERLLERRRYR